jgi:putative addiction module component (TIGR02574 family)
MDSWGADEIGFRSHLVDYKRFRLTAVPLAAKLRIDCRSINVNRTTTSIFDLSPAEKFQLVEDLRNDLAATPEAVPVHDWQKPELDRRKANLAKSPALGLAWDEVKRRVRSGQDR